MREKIRLEVLSIVHLDDLEASTRNQTIQWIDSGVELCRTKKPDIPNKHLVSHFAVVDGDCVLLVDHINTELWLPTRGHVEIR
jgi:8-oxo-dGTP diphosphatase